MRAAICSRCAGVFMNTLVPKFIVPQSRLQSGGRSVSMCASRTSGGTRSVPAPARAGSVSSGT